MAKDIELIFGASNASVGQIRQDLIGIIGQVESSGVTKLKFSVDTGSTSAAVKQINNLGASIKAVNQSSLAGVATSFDKLKTSIVKIKDSGKEISGIQKEFEKLKIAKDAFDKAPTSTNLDAYRSQKIAVNSLVDAFKASEKETYSASNSLMQYKKLLSQVETEYNKYARNIQKNPSTNNQFKDLISNLKSDISKGSVSSEGVLTYRSQFAELDNALIETGGKVETLAQKFRDLFGIHLSTALTMVGIHALVQGLSQVYQNVVQLDQAVVNLQVATGYSRGQTQELIGMYSQYAKELGATTKQVADAGDTWLRQGYSTDQTNKLIKDSMMLSKLGQMDASDSTKALTSSMLGYGVAVDDVSKIVDRLVKVDMSAAVSSSYIATAMSEVSTSAKLAGISMDDLVGYIAAIGSTTQD